MQERRDLGREGFGTGGIQEVRVQDRRDAGIEEGFIYSRSQGKQSSFIFWGKWLPPEIVLLTN